MNQTNESNSAVSRPARRRGVNHSLPTARSILIGAVLLLAGCSNPDIERTPYPGVKWGDPPDKVEKVLGPEDRIGMSDGCLVAIYYFHSLKTVFKTPGFVGAKFYFCDQKLAVSALTWSGSIDERIKRFNQLASYLGSDESEAHACDLEQLNGNRRYWRKLVDKKGAEEARNERTGINTVFALPEIEGVSTADKCEEYGDEDAPASVTLSLKYSIEKKRFKDVSLVGMHDVYARSWIEAAELSP